MMLARRVTHALRGRWYGRYGYVRCVVHEDKRPSLRLSDGECGKLLVRCEAGCDPRDILAELRRRELLSSKRRADRDARLDETAKRRPKEEASDRRKRENIARTIWCASRPAAGTLVEIYLRSRGIHGILPPTLRYHRGLTYKRSGLKFPAMVAAVQAPDRHISAVHRTYLAPDGRGKASVDEPKMSLGPLSGGAVRLCAAAPELAIAEGIETALSFMQATGIATWAALSTSGMCSIILPSLPLAATVYVCVDLDPKSHAGEKAAAEAAQRFAAEGRTVKLATPLVGKDMNDALRETSHPCPMTSPTSPT
jgi:phage/plasmid primase-like uncharacterized protein